MIKVALVDDQEVIRQGLTAILERDNDLTVAAEAANGEEAYQVCKWCQPEIVLMDIKMPLLNGVEATKKIKRDFPHIKIIILTTFSDDEYIFEALRQGASGYLLKDAHPAKIIEAIKEVAKGGALIQPEVAQKVIQQFCSLSKSSSAEQDPKLNLLTARELEILTLLGHGKSNQEIAEELIITLGTVKNHLSNILVKLELRDRTQAAIFALKNHLL
ncbi:MAG: response regulator transcription factor [Bacillota bacterium]|nr:response regulator transcription factor [Bacillota bacterium]